MPGDPPDGFLGGDLETSDTLFLVSPHHRAKVTPLFDAQDTFKAIEDAIAAAQHWVYLAYWDLQTDLKTQSDYAKKNGLDSWTDLLLDAAKRGVTVRILLNDFDPDLSRNFHFDAWASYDRLVREAKKAELINGLNLKRFQVICGMHEAELFPDDTLLKLAIAAERGSIISELNKIAKDDGLQEALRVADKLPRTWKTIQVDKSSSTFSLKTTKLRPIHVASNHQKICTVDRTVAFCGGIDAKQGVFDNQKHEQAPFRHDIHCRLDGPPVVDVERNFVGLWNFEVPRFKQFVADINKDALHEELMTTPVAPIDDFIYRLSPGSKFGSGQVQVLRTMTGPVARPPKPALLRDDVEKSYEKLIGKASDYIYIENQYLRWPDVGDWIIDRHKKVKGLKVIIVLPSAPEEAFGVGDLDEITKHGMYLQYELLKRLKKELGSDLGVFTLAAKKTASSATATVPAIHNSPAVYVHSKVCIADDAFAIIGSANLNGRSMRVDNELCIGWLEPPKVRAFRLHLWEELLGIKRAELAKISSYTFLPLWSATAHNNSVLRPEGRQGLVLPYDNEASKGKKSGIIPDIYA
jgi:phosphatidylserine/phosphatidylglycerophosphate/cardiolipin synthase-like enzyme